MIGVILPPERDNVRSAHVIAACTLLSRALGLVRDMLQALVLGAGPVMDVFAIAYRIPNLFRRLFGEGALATSFIPVLTEYEQTREKDARELISVTFTWLAVILGGIVVLGWIGCLVAAPFFRTNAKTEMFLALLAIMLPHLPLICLAALLMAVLQVRNNFVIPALGQVVMNLIWIGGLLFLVSPLGVYGLALAVLLGGAAEWLMQYVAVRRQGLAPRLRVNFSHPGLKQTQALFLPVVFGLAAVQVNTLVDQLIAQFFVEGDGAVSALYYGNNLMQLPLSIFGIAIATAVFPSLVLHAARDDKPAFRRDLSQALRLTLFLSLPTIAITAVLAKPIVVLLFARGSFAAQADATPRAAAVLTFFILGLWAYCAVHVLSRAFYSLHDSKTPVRVAVTTTVLNLALNLILVWPMREAGLALSTSICGAFNAIRLAYLLRKRVGRIGALEMVVSGAKCVNATIAAGVLCAVTLWFLRDAGGPGIIGKLIRVFAPMGVGLAVFTFAAWATGMRELRELTRALIRRRKDQALRN